MKIGFFFFCLSVVLLKNTDVVAQAADLNKSVRANNIINRFSNLNQRLNTGDVIMGMPSSEESEVVGNGFWDEHWGKSSLLLFKNDDLVEGYTTRYDILNDVFQFQIKNSVRVLPGNKVKNIVWIDSITNRTRLLINAKDFVENEIPISGFLEILVEGEVSLIKKIRLEILKPDFNTALNVGSKDTRIVKKELYYYSVGNSLTQIKSKKDLGPLFGERNKEMDTYMKKENIKLNSEFGLIKLFTYYTGQ